MNRRDFLKTTAFAMAASGFSTASPAMAAATCSKKYKTCLHKALICSRMDDALCARLKAAGFPGVELNAKNLTLDEARAGLALAEKNGLQIHSFMGGWQDFNNPDPTKRKAAVELTKKMLRLASAYHVPSMLLVPSMRVSGMPMPKVHEFQIEFNSGTLEVTRVVAGDNAPYARYIEAQNRSTRFAAECLKALIPVAAEEGVVMALENVWNNLWVKPDFASAFIRSFNNPWVQSYLDLGNHVKYAPVEEWVAAMKGITKKMHIKDFKIDKTNPNGGKFVSLGTGSINWISVREAIEKAEYNGWVSVEEWSYKDAEYSKMMDRFFAGQPILG